MPISLADLQKELLPGLAAVYGRQKEIFAAQVFNQATSGLFVPAAPWIWIPKPVELAGAGVAAAIIKNPEVTRRFWKGWFE